MKKLLLALFLIVIFIPSNAEEKTRQRYTQFEATAYSLRGRTAMGTYVKRGIIAADPKIVPLGSKVRLEAGKYSGEYAVHDTGRLIKRNKIDIWVPHYHEAVQFGRRKVKLTILRYGK